MAAQAGRARLPSTVVHELALCEAIARTVADRAAGRTVARACVRIGHFRQVVPDSLSFCWDVLTEQTPLHGCELDVEHVPAVVACASCGATSRLDVPILACSACGSADVSLESGEELMLVSIELGAAPQRR